MENIEEKVVRYSRNISFHEVEDAIKVYYSTNNSLILYNIIDRYVDGIKKRMQNKGKKTYEDEEDILQNAYVFLLECIENYKQTNSLSFAHLYIERIRKIKNNQPEETESLDTIDVIANSNIEDMVVSEEYNEEILNKIKKILHSKKDTRSVEILIKYISSGLIKKVEIAQHYKVSQQFVNYKIKALLSQIYLELYKKYSYIPSKQVKSALTKKCYNRQHQELIEETKKYADLLIYSSCDTISDSHDLVRHR